MDFFTIKDLENISGIKAHTIRIWEQRYEFLKPNRTDTNIRTYTNQDLKRVLNIALLNKYAPSLGTPEVFGLSEPSKLGSKLDANI